MLATARVSVLSATGHCMQLRALLDNGSQASFISEFAVQQLHLHRTRVQVPVTGVGGKDVGTASGLVQLSICSLRNQDLVFQYNAIILPRLGQLMPHKQVDRCLINELMDLHLADSFFF